MVPVLAVSTRVLRFKLRGTSGGFDARAAASPVDPLYMLIENLFSGEAVQVHDLAAEYRCCSPFASRKSMV